MRPPRLGAISPARPSPGRAEAAPGAVAAAHDHRPYRQRDQDGGERYPQVERLAGERPAEEHRDHRVDERVGRDPRRAGDAQQPDVGAVGDERAEDDQVGEARERAGGGAGQGQLAQLAARGAEDQQRRAAGEHLHRRPLAVRLRRRQVAGQERARGPGGRGPEQDEGRAPGDAAAGDPPAGLHQHGHSREADHEPDQGEPRGPLAAGTGGVEEHHPERHGGDDQGRQARRHELLGPDDAAVAAAEHEAAGHRRRRPVPPLGRTGPPPPDGVQQPAGDEKPGARHQERRQGLHREADGEVGRAPDHVDGQKGRHDQRGSRGRRPRLVHAFSLPAVAVQRHPNPAPEDRGQDTRFEPRSSRCRFATPEGGASAGGPPPGAT